MASVAALLSVVVLVALTPADALNLMKRAQVLPDASGDPWIAEFVIAPGQGDSHAKSGTVEIKVHPEWAPLGAARFKEILQAGNILNGARFFRVVPNFMIQFGIPPEAAVAKQWIFKHITDDPVSVSNKRGLLTFATSGKDSRTTQMFINTVDNSFLDNQGFSPFAEVIKGMDIIDSIYSGAGEKPDQGQIETKGNTYLAADFPQLTFIQHATLSSGASYLAMPQSKEGETQSLSSGASHLAMPQSKEGETQSLSSGASHLAMPQSKEGETQSSNKSIALHKVVGIDQAAPNAAKMTTSDGQNGTGSDQSMLKKAVKYGFERAASAWKRLNDKIAETRKIWEK
eukprot:gnl/TRDRNA2_/TRDRNA2_86068_c0_seq4.p1 gnl/TRDRNA2_/TRDRNA2_86068_c0~~gnl/TRDRNA2_/TRDRNA2_86068_c0_seq4.p1  ORF type:complete len:343 (-),score=70.15 gnl/TRDRNA2_/TRDRNA2_86068_c0_seq4:151-1179(-)